MYFIYGNVPSLKNGKIKTQHGVFSSKTVKNYLRLHGIEKYSSSRKEVLYYKKTTSDKQFSEVANQIKQELLTKTPPYLIGFHFIRNSKHRFDFGNAVELISDLFTAHNVWEDDNSDYFLPFPLQKEDKWYSYDKEHPGVIIKILNDE